MTYLSICRHQIQRVNMRQSANISWKSGEGACGKDLASISYSFSCISFPPFYTNVHMVHVFTSCFFRLMMYLRYHSVLVYKEFFPFLKKILFICVLAAVGLCCCMGFPLVAASRGCSLAAVGGLCIAVASPVAEHGLPGRRFQ